eukprot:XP_003245989.1 PREDICTED: uncharacterized protein LOC100568640 [Acyrthosiphon pisum]
MHKCIVCFNKSNKTKVNHPGVIYHAFSKNVYMRKRWLKVFGIERCHDWQRICSDHLLEDDYKPEKKRILCSTAIPQPYDRNVFLQNFQKNVYMRKRWLKVFGIERCHDWQRICSDHLLEDDYKPEKKRILCSTAIPQPYDRNVFLQSNTS